MNESVWFICACVDLVNLRLMSITYFLYLFLFSGLEYSLTFLVHQRFNYTRQVTSLSLSFFHSWAVLLFSLLPHSMQQGKMFLFIGIIMVLVQGGLTLHNFIRLIVEWCRSSDYERGILCLMKLMIVHKHRSLQKSSLNFHLWTSSSPEMHTRGIPYSEQLYLLTTGTDLL